MSKPRLATPEFWSGYCEGYADGIRDGIPAKAKKKRPPAKSTKRK